MLSFPRSDDNADHAGMMGKTPAARTRRAFGDISNRKIPATTASTPAPIKPLVHNKTTLKASHIPPQARTTSALSQFVVESSLSTSNNPVAPANNNKNDMDIVDDIERPAGRLWIQQHDYDDDSSDATSLSLEGAASMRHDILELLDQRWKNDRLWELQDEGRLVQQWEEHVTRVLQQDGDDGTSKTTGRQTHNRTSVCKSRLLTSRSCYDPHSCLPFSSFRHCL